MYYTYILRCNDNTLYTGYTSDVARRLNEHNTGKGAKYTRTRLPCSLVYTKASETKSEAMKLECKIKRLTRADKLKLIRGELEI